MPLKPNPNQKIYSLPTTANKVLVETACGVCEEIAPIKIRKDGWAELQCTGKNGCGNIQKATKEKSLSSLMRAILLDDETIYRRASKEQIIEAFDVMPRENDFEPLQIFKPQPELIAPEPEIEPQPEFDPEPSFEPDPEQFDDPELDDEDETFEELLGGV